MESFVENLQSPAWWISVVVVGIILSVVSQYLKEVIDSSLSRISVSWRSRSEKAKANRLREIEVLRGDNHKQYLLLFEEMRNRISAGVYTILAFLIAIFSIFMTPGTPRSVFLFVAGLLALFGFISHVVANNNKLLIEDAITNKTLPGPK